MAILAITAAKFSAADGIVNLKKKHLKYHS
jgi:hypothetical protein